MAQQDKRKNGRRSPRVAVADGQAPPARSAEAAAVLQLEQECARLRAELAEARAENDTLKGRCADALVRVDWTIDFLHNVLEAEP